MRSKFYLIMAVVITFLLLPSSTFAKKAYTYATWEKAAAACRESVEDMQDHYTGFLINAINEVRRNIDKNHYAKKKAKKRGYIPPKELKQLVDYFKKGHLNFNKRIKEYQRKCKYAEKILKGGIGIGAEE